MWHKILHDAWYDIFHDPVLGGHAPEDYGIDHVSWHLVDSVRLVPSYADGSYWTKTR